MSSSLTTTTPLPPRAKKLSVKVHLYSPPTRVEDDHSYRLGHVPGGVGPVLETIQLETHDNLRTLRQKMEVLQDGNMTRRTLLFQEIRFLCQTAPNPHGWALKIKRTSYQLGVQTTALATQEEKRSKKARKSSKKSTTTKVIEDEEPDLTHDSSITETQMEKIELIPLEEEDEITIAEVVQRSVDGCSVVVVPRALVGPSCGRCCLGCSECTAGKLQDSITHYYLDGAIHTVRQGQMGEVKIDKFVDLLSL